MTLLEEPLSPELALVCPELKRHARAALPDPPWAPTAAARPSRPAAREPQHASSRPRPSKRIVALGLLGAAAVAVALALETFPRPDDQTLALPQTPPHGIRMVAEHAAHMAASTTHLRPAEVRRPPAAVTNPRSMSAGAAAGATAATIVQPPKRRAVHRAMVNLAHPGGRYTIATGGHFQVAPDAGSIRNVAVDVPCFGHLVFTRIPVAADGRFAAFRRAMGKSSVFSVSVAGGFVSKTEAGLRITATGGGCAPHALQARGRLG